jgi:glycosyltransferase involved in cell wall biosynthesis
MKLLYFSPASQGGLADYAHAQANALASLGAEVTLLCTPDYPTQRGERYRIVPRLKPLTPIGHRLSKAIHYTDVILSQYRQLVQLLETEHFQSVLLGAYAEYLAPFWAPALQRLAQQGVMFGAIVHDPVRDFRVGPQWWHRWSVAAAYSPIRFGFVHEPIVLETYRPMEQLKTVVIPHGVYQFPHPTQSRLTLRAKFNLPQDATVLLSFGHIRDGKNLDLVIRAMGHYPDLYLVVAGKEQSAGQRPAAYYQELAAQLGVSDRCRWQVRFIPETEIGDFFEISDLAVLTYSKDFRSASGVINTAVYYQKPCLASSGVSALQSVVEQYGLGIWVESDSESAIVDGIQTYLTTQLTPRWQQYCELHSWEYAAKTVINCFETASTHPEISRSVL